MSEVLKKVCQPAPAPVDAVGLGSNPAPSNHSQSLMAGNFAALWPTDSKFSALKDLILFSTVSKDQKASSILKVGFALSKWPHLHRAYVVSVWFFLNTIVSCFILPLYEVTLTTTTKKLNKKPELGSQIKDSNKEPIELLSMQDTVISIYVLAIFLWTQKQ